MPAAFGIPELCKGFFPHLFNKAENWNSCLLGLPDKKFYNPDGMKPGTKSAFIKWYEEHKFDSFVFQEELLKYCKSDVDILRRSCIQFRKMFMDITSRNGNSGIDPFERCITIASACNLVFRTIFLEQESIGIIPSHGYRPRYKQSIKALQWLEYQAKTRQLGIVHAWNGGEKKIGPYYVDGYYEVDGEKVVLEFHGDFWHGCPKCYSGNTVNPVTDTTMSDLYQKTIDKRVYLEQQEHCTVPSIPNGLTPNNIEGYKVPLRYKLKVVCLPVHSPSTQRPTVCTETGWKNIPNCVLDYELHGNEKEGYAIFTESGEFYVYPEMTLVRAIGIGGGGGGFDGRNHSSLKAGDGGETVIKYSQATQYELQAEGGKGGTKTKGGIGGSGNEVEGGNGGHSANCTGGGAAGETRSADTGYYLSGFSELLFCGGGGEPAPSCKIKRGKNRERDSGPGGCPLNGSAAGLFGGGAGGFHGGAGGGGGYSRHEFNPTIGAVLQITVGKGGTPSYAQAGGGVVVISWQVDLYQVAQDLQDNDQWTCQ
ncbi:hypothetical protein ScPMuIL_003117 [Solemya velum]